MRSPLWLLRSKMILRGSQEEEEENPPRRLPAEAVRASLQPEPLFRRGPWAD